MLKKPNKNIIECQAQPLPLIPTSPDYFRALVVTITLFILVNLCFDSLLFWQLHRSKIQDEKVAETHVANLSKVLEQSVYTLLREIDLTLLGLSDDWRKQTIIGVLSRDDFQALMQIHAQRLPAVLGLRLANAQGQIICSTGEMVYSNVNIADRDHFKVVRDNPNSGMVIGKPVPGRITHKWVLPVSRRLSYPDGSFGGELHAFISTDTLSTMFSSLDLGPHGVVSMWDKTTTLARYPQKINGRDTIGVSKPSPQLKLLLDSETMSAQYRATAPTDGVLKTYAINKVGGLPLWTIVGLAESDYLAPWRSEAKKMGLLGLIFAGVSLVSAMQFFRYWKFSRCRIGEILIRETDEQLRAAQTLARIGSWVKDLRSGTYLWSDEVYRILGIDPEAMVLRPALNPESFPDLF